MHKRIVKNNRLVYYGRKADPAFWDAEWLSAIQPDLYARAEKGFLGEYRRSFIKHLPKQGRILEAGCGLGLNVLALRARGYDCEGLDYARKAVEAVQAIRRDIPIRVGDVTRIDVPDGYYQGYISLGVIEHLEQGPAAVLREAYRVLSDHGVAYISAPNFHVIRRIKGRLGLYRDRIDGLEFYQYAFTRSEMMRLFGESGFSIIGLHNYACWNGLRDELPVLALFDRIPALDRACRITARNLPFVKILYGHMTGFILKKFS